MGKDKGAYKTYHCRLEFRNGLAGGQPLTRDLAHEYARRYQARVTSELALSRKEEGEVTHEAIDKFIEGITSVFPFDEEGAYIQGHQVIAMLRDALSLSKLGKGTKATFLKFMIQNGGVTVPPRIRLDSEPEMRSRPVSPEVKGRRVSSIARFEVASEAKVEFDLGVIQNDELNKTELRQLFTVGGEVGLGSFRHLGWGKFDLAELT